MGNDLYQPKVFFSVQFQLSKHFWLMIKSLDTCKIYLFLMCFRTYSKTARSHSFKLWKLERTNWNFQNNFLSNEILSKKKWKYNVLIFIFDTKWVVIKVRGLEYTVPFSSMTACENLLMEKLVFRATSARTTLTFPTKGKYWTAICIIWAPIKQQNNDVDILPYQKVNRNIVHAIFLVFFVTFKQARGDASLSWKLCNLFIVYLF